VVKLSIDIFLKEIEQTIASGLPFVIYRKPNDKQIFCLVQKNDNFHELTNFDEAGFVFAPFNKKEKSVIFPLKQCKFLTSTIETNLDVELQKNNVFKKTVTSNKTKNKHILLVKKAIDCIKKGDAKKIVVSRKEILEYSNFCVLNSLKNMLNTYKNAFVYTWYHPNIGMWMGATPERLLSISKNNFSTMALAGTQPYKNTLDVSWEQKEIMEQQFVTDYIVNNLAKSITNISISKPYTVKAGNLVHICTDISGKIEFSNSIKKLTSSLHPTPAVCGLPLTVANNFILNNENYNRSYYTGYLGELNIKNNSNLFVNLRCMLIKNQSISIYVGGGITIDSNPEKEWEETVAKAKVMKKIL